jgi:beta-glucosidase
MREVLSDRISDFTPAEWAVVEGSSDFYRMNPYTKSLIQAGGDDEFQGLTTYMFTRPDGTQLGTQGHSAWLQAYAPGFRALMNYLYKRYQKPIYCTENGFSVMIETNISVEEALKGAVRLEYYRDNLNALFQTVLEDGVEVKSYFAWSLLDNFEWATATTPTSDAPMPTILP